jgi:hypothetical protein
MRRELVGAAVLLALAVAAPAADAKSQTLRFYQQGGPTQFYNSAGKPINVSPPTTLPKAGDSFDETDLDFTGSYKHTAKHWSASDFLTCKFSDSDTATCDEQFAIGGSLLVFDGFTLHFDTNSATLKLTAGSGKYRGVHGTQSLRDVPNGNDNLVLRLS